MTARYPLTLSALAFLLALAPPPAAAEDVEVCGRNAALFLARVHVEYDVPGRPLRRSYTGSGFSGGGERCVAVPSYASDIEFGIDAEVQRGKWKTLCSRRFAQPAEAKNFAFVVEGSQFAPACRLADE